MKFFTHETIYCFHLKLIIVARFVFLLLHTEDEIKFKFINIFFKASIAERLNHLFINLKSINDKIIKNKQNNVSE